MIFFHKGTITVLIGNKHTGKTYFVTRAIQKNEVSFKNILIYNPAASGLKNQHDTYDSLRLKYPGRVKIEIINTQTCPPNPMYDLVIFDDFDNSLNMPYWLMTFFSVSVHHENRTCFVISHKIKTGNVLLRNCMDTLIVFELPDLSDRADLLKFIKIPNSLYFDTISNKKNIITDKFGCPHNYNNLIIKVSSIYDEAGEIHRFYTTTPKSIYSNYQKVFLK